MFNASKKYNKTLDKNYGFQNSAFYYHCVSSSGRGKSAVTALAGAFAVCLERYNTGRDHAKVYLFPRQRVYRLPRVGGS